MSSTAPAPPAKGARLKRAREGDEDETTKRQCVEVTPGVIRVGQKFSRGVAGDRSATCEGFLNIDVTSGSGNKLEGIAATTLSPLKLGPVLDTDGKVLALVFENYYQGGKQWPTAGHIQPGTISTPTPAWFAFRDKQYKSAIGKRRPLPLKRYGTPTASYYSGRPMTYVESRKFEYVPKYSALIKGLPFMEALERLVKSGQPVLLNDNDGPPKQEFPNGLEMTPENWKRMINDPSKRFGHVYTVARDLALRCNPSLKFEDD